jgi:hypothetical protein
MMHLFMRKGPWFRAKSHGFGTRLPIVWEGWLLLALHVALITGVAVAVALQGWPVAMTIAVIVAGLAPMPIYRAKTEGGWRWR